MYQQINLYQPVFRRQRKIFSASTMLQVLGIATMVLSAFYAHAAWTLQRLENTEATLAGSYNSLENRVGILENAGVAGAAPSVADELERLQRAIDSRQALLDSIGEQSAQGNARFSDFLDVLARHTVPGLWLTGIRLDETGETELRGTTFDPELVPRYLQKLPDGQRVSTLYHGSVHLERRSPDDPTVQFTISSIAGETL